jgi:hypothetical protein
MSSISQVPPSECCSLPYNESYVRWAVEIAKLSLQYPISEPPLYAAPSHLLYRNNTHCSNVRSVVISRLLAGAPLGVLQPAVQRELRAVGGRDRQAIPAVPQCNVKGWSIDDFLWNTGK